MTACPTPDKRRYATVRAAESYAASRQVGIGKVLAPYECECGWWHLTSQPRVPGGPADPAVVNELRHASPTAFTAVVEDDATGHLPMPQRIALRQPRLYGRWTRALRAVADRLDTQITTAPAGSTWRRRAEAYRAVIRQRLDEADTLHTRWPA